MPYERIYSNIAMQYRLEQEFDNVMGVLIVSDISFFIFYSSYNVFYYSQKRNIISLCKIIPMGENVVIEYITVKEASVNWGVTVRHVRYYVHKIKFKELFALEVVGQYLKI